MLSRPVGVLLEAADCWPKVPYFDRFHASATERNVLMLYIHTEVVVLEGGVQNTFPCSASISHCRMKIIYTVWTRV